MLNFLTKGTELTQNQRNRIEKARKAQLIQNLGKMYLHAGHGRDLCDEKGPIKDTVPEGCLFITIAKCGLPNYAYDTRYKLFASKDETIQNVLKNPTVPGNKKLLAKWLQVDEEDINIKYPGDSFVINSFYPLQSWFDNDNVKKQWKAKLGYSGVIDVDILKEVFDPAYNMVDIMSPDFEFDKIVIDFNNEVIRKLADDITMDSFDNKIHLNKIRQKLLILLKSIYPWDTKYSASEIEGAYKSLYSDTGIPERITKEAEDYYPREVIQHYLGHSLFAKKKWVILVIQNYANKEVSKSFLQEFYVMVAFTIVIDEFLKFFSASVYPTKDIVGKILKEKNRDSINPHDFHNIGMSIKNYLDTENNQTKNCNNLHIMKTYPGIHYQFVCRSVDEKCEKLAVIRRSNSAIQYETQQKYNEFIYGKNLSDPNNILYSDDDITIVRPGTFGSIPIIFKLYNSEGNCAEEIRWEKDEVILPKYSIPVSYDLMKLEERIQNLYGIQLDDIENEIRYNYYGNSITLDKIITMDVDPYKTKVESTENYGEKILLIDYLKNPIPENNRIYSNKLPKNIPAEWISSCYEFQEISARPSSKLKSTINGMLLNYPESSTSESSIQKRKELLNEKSKLNAWENKRINALKNKSKWKSTQKYGGKRKLKRNKRTAKK